MKVQLEEIDCTSDICLLVHNQTSEPKSQSATLEDIVIQHHIGWDNATTRLKMKLLCVYHESST